MDVLLENKTNEKLTRAGKLTSRLYISANLQIIMMGYSIKTGDLFVTTNLPAVRSGEWIVIEQ